MISKITYEGLAAYLKSALGPVPPLSALPQPEQMRDMERAAGLIAAAIYARENIAIVGDYDVDGVVATTILSEFFAAINYPVRYKIPNRFTDGYGISAAIVEQLAAEGAQLIITVDNGITALEAAARARELGVKIIITDHHEMAEQLPAADAVVDPKRPDCGFADAYGTDICGAQVAWYLCAALKRRLGAQVDLAGWLDVLCLAINADMMPMRGANRTLMHAGLRALNCSRKPFMAALRAKFARERFEFENISFLLSPLLNSAGRMDDASKSVEFLRACDFASAMAALEALCALNDARKATEAEIFAAAEQQIAPTDAVAIAAGEGWSRGVIGIVAGRLASKFKRAAVVFSIEPDGRAIGSARGWEDLNLLELFERCRPALLGFGGHKSAAGISCEAARIAEFRALANACEAHCHGGAAAAGAGAIFELGVEDCTLATAQLLESFAPYGMGFERPEFVAIAEVASVRELSGGHLKLSLLPTALSAGEYLARRGAVRAGGEGGGGFAGTAIGAATDNTAFASTNFAGSADGSVGGFGGGSAGGFVDGSVGGFGSGSGSGFGGVSAANGAATDSTAEPVGAMFFRYSGEIPAAGELAFVRFSLDLNTFRGVTTPQITLTELTLLN